MIANMTKVLLHKCGETGVEDEIRLLEEKKMQGNEEGCQMESREEIMRPQYCRAGKGPSGPSDTALFSEAGSNRLVLFLAGHSLYSPLNVYVVFFTLFTIYSEYFCHSLGMLLLTIFNMDTKAKCSLQQIFIYLSAIMDSCLSLHFFMLNCDVLPYNIKKNVSFTAVADCFC